MSRPYNGLALGGVVCDFLVPGEGRDVWRVDDFVLEDYHHEAFVGP